MNLHDLSPAKGSRKEKNRKGRGRAARRGESAGRGLKGQKKRSNVPIFFEGGQTPLYRRIPKRGFNSPNRVRTQEVNVSSLNRFESGSTITPEQLLDSGLINKVEPVKLLGNGDLDVDLTVQVHAASNGAREKIESAGGSVEIISRPGQ